MSQWGVKKLQHSTERQQEPSYKLEIIGFILFIFISDYTGELIRCNRATFEYSLTHTRILRRHSMKMERQQFQCLFIQKQFAVQCTVWLIILLIINKITVSQRVRWCLQIASQKIKIKILIFEKLEPAGLTFLDVFITSRFSSRFSSTDLCANRVTKEFM